jgi:hypothetical protein
VLKRRGAVLLVFAKTVLSDVGHATRRPTSIC